MADDNWGTITSVERIEVDPVRERSARVKDIATLDERLTAEIRRQTEYLLLALVKLSRAGIGTEGGAYRELLELPEEYALACAEADKVRRP